MWDSKLRAVAYEDERGEGVMCLEYTDATGQVWTMEFCAIGATCPIPS